MLSLCLHKHWTTATLWLIPCFHSGHKAAENGCPKAKMLWLSSWIKSPSLLITPSFRAAVVMAELYRIYFTCLTLLFFYDKNGRVCYRHSTCASVFKTTIDPSTLFVTLCSASSLSGPIKNASLWFPPFRRQGNIESSSALCLLWNPGGRMIG